MIDVVYTGDIRHNQRIGILSTDCITKKSKDDAYTSLMKTYVKDLERITKDLKPCSYTVISGSGTAYFLEPLTRTFVKTERGAEVVVVPGDPDDDGKLLVRTMNTFLLVPHEEIIDLGYN